MKKILGLAFYLLVGSAMAQTYQGYADIPGEAKAFAVTVEQYNRGTGIPDDLAIPESVLGAPDYYTGGKALTTGSGGNFIVSFGDTAVRADGTDESEVYIYEVEQYEPWTAWVSDDMENWTQLQPSFTKLAGSGNRGSVVGYDLDKAGLTTFKYFKLIDKTNDGGPDVDGIVLTHTRYIGGGEIIDTDSRNGIVFNLEKNKETGVVDVKKIDKDGNVDYIQFSNDNSLEPLALSVQGNFDCDDEKDINVLVTRKDDGVQLNIIKDQEGKDILTIDNSITN